MFERQSSEVANEEDLVQKRAEVAERAGTMTIGALTERVLEEQTDTPPIRIERVLEAMRERARRFNSTN